MYVTPRYRSSSFFILVDLAKSLGPRSKNIAFQVTTLILEVGIGLWFLTFGLALRLLDPIHFQLGYLFLAFLGLSLQLTPFRVLGWFTFYYKLIFHTLVFNSQVVGCNISTDF